MSKTFLQPISIRILVALLGIATTARLHAAPVSQYNVLWDSPSVDCNGSMPIGNGDIGANVWVEDGGDLLFYIGKTDAREENARLVKPGKVRVRLNPNPFAHGCAFRQELDLADGVIRIASAAEPQSAKGPVAPTKVKDIKAYCLDFNWGGRRAFAKPGSWAGADPAKHVAWYKAMGANVIQTFCVSCNGYAWYKNGVVPEQPGLKYDFLPEMVRLGHHEGMLVMGYFCIAANTRWGQEHPDLSYGTPSTYHIPYTDEYLAYLSTTIGDAVRKTGIDGFMIDWVWQPNRESTGGKWLECEKKLYAQLMGEVFPGEDKLSKAQEVAYGRKAIDRCWQTMRKAAKDANPNCIVWLTSNNTTHPHVVNSSLYKEADWLMNEAGDLKRINAIKPMIGKDTRLITCLAGWNGQDATKLVPEALQAGIGLYGFAKPAGNSLLPLEQLLARPVNELKGDDRNIAVLARAYHGVSIAAVRNDKGEFVEPIK